MASNGARLSGSTSYRYNASCRWYDADESAYVGFKSPATITASVEWTLPTSDSTGTQALVSNGSGALSWSSFGSGDGTVTSVGLSLPSIFSVSGSPVTSSGTLTGALATQTANTLFAGPAAAPAAAPTFRALVVADFNGGSGASASTFWRGDGTWATPSGVVSSVFGRTGAVVAATNDYTWAQINKATSSIADITTRNFSDTTGTVAESRGGTNQTSYTYGDFLYASATNTLGKLAGNTTTTKKYMSMTGTGAAAGEPIWSQPAFSELSGSASLTSQVSGTLPIANGGTNNTSYSASKYLTYFDGTKLADSPFNVVGDVISGTGGGFIAWALTSIQVTAATGDELSLAVNSGGAQAIRCDYSAAIRIGFFGAAPAARASAYTPTNVVTDRSYNADSTSVAELADVLGTLIADLQSYGLLQ